MAHVNAGDSTAANLTDWANESDDDILATLDADCETACNEKKPSPRKNRRDDDTRDPMWRFRPRYLWVSDLCAQTWCEHKLLYSFTLPALREETPAITQGTSLHLARELEVHDIKEIKTTSREDAWAIKILNMVTVFQGFLGGGSLAREVPIFGSPYEFGVFCVGVIDELRFDPESHSLSLLELKTRTGLGRPSRCQQQQHKLQVRVYKRLLDDLIMGTLSKETIAKHLRVKLDAGLGDAVLEEITSNGLDVRNLDQLLDRLLLTVASMTCVQHLMVEYVHQEKGETLFITDVDFDDNALKSQLQRQLEFWTGARPPLGVDIEEAWKCQRCEFADVCEWRKARAEQCSKNNQKANMAADGEGAS